MGSSCISAACFFLAKLSKIRRILCETGETVASYTAETSTSSEQDTYTRYGTSCPTRQITLNTNSGRGRRPRTPERQACVANMPAAAPLLLLGLAATVRCLATPAGRPHRPHLVFILGVRTFVHLRSHIAPRAERRRWRATRISLAGLLVSAQLASPPLRFA